MDIQPPPGWEAPPPAPALPTPRTKVQPAVCCRSDKDCCLPQTEIDNAQTSIKRVLAIAYTGLPSATVKDAPKDGPGVEGAPALRFLDGKGSPPPWPGGPSREVRVLPPGRFGEVRWGEDWEPFFADKDYQSMGYGVRRDVRKGEPANTLQGKVEMTWFSQGEGGKVVCDFIEGKLAGKPELVATRWVHAEAVPVAEDLGHAYRLEGGVVIVFPEVIQGLNPEPTRLKGGFFPSRFSRSVAFSEYTMPARAGTSAVATFVLLDQQVRRWFPRPKGAGKPAESFSGLLSSSQTSAEGEPSIRLVER